MTDTRRPTQADEIGGMCNEPKDSSKGSTVLLGAIVTAMVTLLFLLVFWNHFLGLRSGDGGYTSAIFFLNGILPYRDYFLMVPPLYMAHCAAVLAIFGKLPIVLRGFAVFERVGLAVLLYGWLVRFFRVKDAAFAAIVTIVVSAGDYADPISSYNHFTILLAIAAGFVASYALDEWRSVRALVILGCTSGVLSLLCFASKQTIGIGITFAIPFVLGLCLLKFDGVRNFLSFLSGFTAGWIFSASAVLGWMWHMHLLRLFLIQSFVTGPAAKASHPGDYWTHTLAVLEIHRWAALMACVVLALSWGAIRRSGQLKQEGFSDSLKGLALVLILGVGAIGVSQLHLFKIPSEQAAKPTIYLSLFGSGMLILYYLWTFLKGDISRRQSQFALFAATSFVVAFMISLSFPAFEAMCVPGLAIFVAVLLNDFEDWRKWPVYATCVLLLFCQTQAKMFLPFGFDNWYEPPVKEATMTSSLPELKGFLLPENTIRFVDSTVQIIRENSTPQDTIFVYPELGLFYGLAQRRPATFSGSHNMDTVSDALAKEEAQRLLRARPAVLICGKISEREMQASEGFWRNGRPSGQRDLIAATQQLMNQYRLVAEFEVYPYGREVYVFVRPQ